LRRVKNLGVKDLCGKYLKARQLAKEMEEKAKKTAEMKEEAQDEKERAEKILDEIDSLDVELDFADLKDEFEEGKNHLDKKKFEKAFEIFNGTIEGIKEESREKIDEILDPLMETLENAESDEDIESMFEDIERSKELIDDGNIKEALDKALDIKDRSDEFFVNKLENKISSLDTLFNRIEKDNDEVLHDAEELLSKAEYSLEAEDYSRAFSLLGEAEGSIGKETKDKLIGIIETLEQRIEHLKENGNDLDESEKSLQTAREKIEEDIIEGWDIIEKTSEKVNEVYGEEILSDAFEKIEDEISEAEDIGAPTEEIEKMVEKAKEFKDENEILEVENILDEAFEKIEEAKFDKVLNTIAESREDFIKAKEMGADIEKPMQLLKKARNSLKNDDYKEALEWARKGREKVQDLTDKLEELKDQIQNKEKEVKQLEETLQKEFSSLKDIIEEARTKLEQKSPEEAVSKLEELDDKIERSARSEVQEIADEFEKLNKLAQDLEIEVGELSKQQVECKRKIVSSEYLTAANMALSGKNKVEQMIKEKIENEIERITDEIEHVKGIKDELASDVLDLIKETDKEFNSGSLAEAAEKLNEAKNFFLDERTKLCEDIIEGFSKYIQDVEDLTDGFEDIDDYEEKLEKARSDLSEENFNEALDQIKDFIPELTRKIQKTAEKEVQSAERAGVKVNSLKKELKLSDESFQDDDFVESVDKSLKVLEEAKEKKEQREKAYEKVKEGATELNSIKEEIQGEGVNEVRERLREAKDKFKTRDYLDSIDIAEDALDLLEKVKVKGRFSKAKSELLERSKKAKNLKLDHQKIDDFDPEIEKIEELEEKDEHEKAQEVLESKKSELDDLLLECADEKIKKTREFLKAADNMGFDVEDSRDKLKRANSLYEKEESLKTLTLLEEVEEELKNLRGKGDVAREELEEAICQLKEAEVIDADVDDIKSLLDESEELLKNDLYGESLKKTKEAKEKISEAKQKRIEGIIHDFDKKIKELRSKDVDTALAENKLRKAKKAVDNEDFVDSIRLALQSEGELERVDKQRVIAKNSLSKIKGMLEKVEGKEILVDQARKEIQRCEQAFESGFYPKVVEDAVDASKELYEVLRTHKNIETFLTDFDLLIEELEREELEHSKLKETKENIEHLYKDGKYEKADEKILKAEESIREEKKTIKELISRIEEEISNKGITEVEKAVKKLEKARFLLDLGNPIKALTNIHEAEEISGLKNLREYDKLVSQVESSISNAKKFGASVKDVENLVSSAKKKKDSGEIVKAYEEIKKANDDIEKVLEAYSPKLKLEISKTLIIDKWNPVEILLVNEGEALGKDPDIELRGGDIRNTDMPGKLKAGEEKDIEVEIKPKKENAVVIAKALRIFDDEVFEDKVELDVSMGSDVKKARDTKTCDYCGENIMSGEQFVLCSCEKTYDISCAEEINECLNCGTELETEKEEEEKKQKKKRVSLDL